MQTRTRRWTIIPLFFLALLGALYFRVYHRWRREGLENVPAHGPLIVIINHISMLDVLALGVALMRRGLFPGTHLFTVAKRELFHYPLLGVLLPLIGMFPLHRGRIDLQAMRTVISVFRENKMLGIAPEGARSVTGRLQLFQPVVAKIAITRRVPILPVGIIGTDCAAPIGFKIPNPVPITLRFGPVFELSEYYDRELTPQALDDAAWRMRAHVAELLPEWMRVLPSEQTGSRFGSVKVNSALH